MTVADLIAELAYFPPDLQIFVLAGDDCDMPQDPSPRTMDYGPQSDMNGVYL